MTVLHRALETAESSYKVGEFYRVPCVKATPKHREDRLWRGEWVPVLGPVHRDDGAVNFPYLHWHVDWRFASQRVFNRATKRSHYGLDGIYHHIAAIYQRGGPTGEMKENPFFAGGVVMRRRKCMRELHAYPKHLAQWLPALQRECATMKMKNMVCPHRGLPLKGCEQDGDVVRCPGHGLRWNVKTGELVT